MKSSSSGGSSRRIKFENPPVNELVIALFHRPIAELKAQHIGIYWDRIRKKYPRCEQQSSVALPDAQPSEPFLQVPGEVFPLPRFWFFSDTHAMLIQVQRNGFMFNWRRSSAPAENEYPHYEVVANDFWQEFENYKIFVEGLVEGKLDPIRRCELTYVNLITPNELFASPAQLMNVLPPVASVCHLQTNDRQLAGLNATVTYTISSNLLVDLAVRLGHRSDTKELGIVMELKAHGVPSDLSVEGARAWYNSAHDATYQLFLDATSQEVREKIWKPR